MTEVDQQWWEVTSWVLEFSSAEWDRQTCALAQMSVAFLLARLDAAREGGACVSGSSRPRTIATGVWSVFNIIMSKLEHDADVMIVLSLLFSGTNPSTVAQRSGMVPQSDYGLCKIGNKVSHILTISISRNCAAFIDSVVRYIKSCGSGYRT